MIADASKVLPYTQVIIGTGDLIEKDNLVEFRLLYQGELLSSGNQSRVCEKHAIRRIFHPQLRQLWSVESNLRQLASFACGGDPRPPNERPSPITEQERFDYGIKKIGKKWNRAGYDFVPLVTPEASLRCSLDILLLRPHIEDRFIFRRGDIDGHVKTLFDALRMPDNLDETGGMGPQEDETPFFCLLQDDKLITQVRVTTDSLLFLPNKTEVRPNDAFVVIHVRLNHRSARTFGNWAG